MFWQEEEMLWQEEVEQEVRMEQEVERALMKLFEALEKEGVRSVVGVVPLVLLYFGEEEKDEREIALARGLAKRFGGRVEVIDIE